MIKTCINPECRKDFLTERSAMKYCSRACSNKDRQRVEFSRAREYNFISCGGGIQSAGMIACVVASKLPMPDGVIMVDTGYEKQSTMDYVHNVLIPQCDKIGLRFEIIKTEDNSIFNKQGMIVIPAYKIGESKKTQRLMTLCNGSWKQAVIKRHLRSKGIVLGYSWIGISLDEAHRQRRSSQNWLKNKYPLIELGLTRFQCLYLIRSLGWPDPPRTACIMCPLQADEEWEIMKRHYPDDYARCVAMDESIEAVMPSVYLHHSLTRLRDIVWKCDAETIGGVGSFSTVVCSRPTVQCRASFSGSSAGV